MLLTKIAKDQIQKIFFDAEKFQGARDLCKQIVLDSMEISKNKPTAIEKEHALFDAIDEKLKEISADYHDQIPVRFLNALSERESNQMLDIMNEYGRLKGFFGINLRFVKLYCLSYLNYCELIKIDPEMELIRPNSFFYQSQKNLIRYFLKAEQRVIDRKEKDLSLRMSDAVKTMIEENSENLSLKKYNRVRIDFLKYLRKHRQKLIAKLRIGSAAKDIQTLRDQFKILEDKLKSFLQQRRFIQR